MQSAPRKVLVTASAMGVHNDCLAAEDLCDPCREIIVQAIDHHYHHHATPALAVEAYIDDLLAEGK